MKPPKKSTPSAAPKRRDNTLLLLFGVWAIAFALRCLYLWQIHSAPFFDLRLGDAAAYDAWARTIASGDWLGKGVFYQAPLYPYFLAVIYRVLDDSVLTVRIVQAILGAGSCAFLAYAGISLFGRPGVIAGLLLAIYPPAVFLDGSLEKSALVTFLVVALLAMLARPLWVRPTIAGIILGLLALTRENALILAIPILWWIAIKNRRPIAALAFTAGCAFILLPVAFRNLAVGGEFHLTTSQFGPNFYIGNHAGAKGTYEALVVGHGNVDDEREDATRLAEQASHRNLSPGEVSSFWTGRALDYIRSQPFDWLKLMARKLALTLNAAEISDTESQSVYAEWSWLLKLPFDFGVLLGLAVLAPRRNWLLYALAGAYALSVVFFYVFARYRFPLAPILMLIAAGAVGHLRMGRRLGVAGALAIVAVAFAHLPLHDERRARAATYHSIATALAKEPERSYEALGFYQSALGADPRYPAAQAGLATLLTKMERHQEAIPYYQAAIASWPQYSEAHYNFGLTLAAMGRAQEASVEYEEALRARPDDADTHIALAKTLLELNRPQDAAQHYQRGLSLRPKDVAALVGWGVALTQTGHADEAIRKYQTALLLDPQSSTAHNNLGWTLANLGRVAEAAPHFERALALDPGYESARRNLEQARQILSRR